MTVRRTSNSGLGNRTLRGNRVFITTDTIHARLLNEVSEQLIARGIDVIRGPEDPAEITVDNLVRFLEDAEIAGLTIRQPVNREHLAALPKLTGLCLPVTGVESVDLEAATDMGVLVAHGATRLNSIGIAEATVMLVLAMLYNLPAAQRLMFEGSKPIVPRGRIAYGKKIGLIGFGRIAAAVADRLRPFAVEQMVYSPTTPHDRIPSDIVRVGLDELLRDSDVVIMLATLTPNNQSMLGEREFSLMKTSAFLINTARGALIDEAALIKALAGNQIAGAALDTFAVEPLSPDSALSQMTNVILTPHMVGHTREGSSEFAETMVENIIRLVEGKRPLYCKNPDAIPAWQERRAKLLN